MNFFDVHGHYAWGIDDGMPSEDDCREALKKAKEQNIKTIVATPHFTSGKTTLEDKKKIIERVNDLKKLAEEYQITVRQGCELMLNEFSHDAINQELFLPFEGTKYVLCEYNVTKPTEDFLDDFDDLLRDLRVKGYKPIVAHVERYFHETIDLDYVQYLLDIGCVIQINTTSVLNKGLPVHHKNAIELLDKNMVHVMATDTHRKDGRRCPNMQDAYDALQKEGYQEKDIQMLTTMNPYHLIHGEKVEPTHFKRSFFKKMFSK